MGDAFGLNDLFEDVKAAAPPRVAEAADLRIVSVPGGVEAGQPFSLEYKLHDASGDVVPVPPGCAVETVLQMDSDADGRLAGPQPKAQGSSFVARGVSLTAAGAYTVVTAVTLPDSKKVLRAATKVVVAAAPAAAAEEDAGSDDDSRSASLSLGRAAGRAASEASVSESLGGDSGSESMSASLSRAPAKEEKKKKKDGRVKKEKKPDKLSPLLGPSAPVTTYEFTQRGKDHDKHGVLYYLGLNKLKDKRWVNPVLRGQVNVTSSSLRKGEARNFVERRPVDQLCLCTEDEEGSWVQVDLKRHVCAPHTYTLANRCDKSRDVLTSWTLEGSIDGKLWVVIHQHKNDQNLNDARLRSANSHTWKIAQCKYYFRFFRVRIGAQGNTSQSNVLASTCLELYGYFRTRHESEGADGVPRPVEAPILDKLGLSATNRNTDFRDLIKSRYGIKERKGRSGAAASASAGAEQASSSRGGGGGGGGGQADKKSRSERARGTNERQRSPPPKRRRK